MELEFNGAAGFVTGSCHRLTIGKKQLLVDCGMYQGTKDVSRRNYEPFNFDPKKIDAVLLTHAHIDHSGLLPKLVAKGFTGSIYCTSATMDLVKHLLIDSAHIHFFENKYDNRRLKAQGLPLRKPLYTVKDAEQVFKQLKGVSYKETVRPFDGVCAIFKDAGHILGSAIIEVFAEGKKIVFSGDLGNKDAPIIDDPTVITEADYVVCESTYGGRAHERASEKNQLLLKAIKDTYKKGGKLIIPAFAVERTQEILYRLNEMQEDGKLPAMPIFVDSPLGIKATRVFIKHTENYDEEARAHLAHGDQIFQFKGLKFLEKSQQSKELNTFVGPCIIISSSGMCSGGRIKHHLKHHLPGANNMILFVGYQARGTLGRRIKEGQKNVRIYGESIRVRAEVRSITGFSAHADQPQLLKWLGAFKTDPKIFLVHGDPEEAQVLRGLLPKGNVAKLHQKVTL